MLSKLTLMMVPWLLSTEVVVGLEGADWLGQAPGLVVEQREAAVGQESLQSFPQLGVPSHCSFLSWTPSPQKARLQVLLQALGAKSELRGPSSHSSSPSTSPSPQTVLTSKNSMFLPFLGCRHLPFPTKLDRANWVNWDLVID